ncbi:MAG: hypothetical protein PHD05_02265 [Sphaerochaetaceae bacterium]|nr:hypothetical protein [Sphaerochaetaceae bacterium]
MDQKQFFLEQLNDVLTSYAELKKKNPYYDYSNYPEEVTSLIIKSKAVINRITGNNSDFSDEVKRALEKKELDGFKLKHIIGTVTALKDSLEKDYLKGLGEIIHSEIFTDFLEMSEYLLSEGYKDASAVIAGSTLEEHLRKICIKNNILLTYQNNKGDSIFKKADSLNSELGNLSIYTKSIQKQITAWLDIRNNAAHGKYSEYTSEQVKLMIEGINNFIATNPA